MRRMRKTKRRRESADDGAHFDGAAKDWVGGHADVAAVPLPFRRVDVPSMPAELGQLAWCETIEGAGCPVG